MRHAFAVLLMAILPGAAAAQPASGPNFDCARASRPVETAVCADPALSALDRLLDRAYRLALDGLAADRAAALKGDQLRWMVERNRAAAAPGDARAALMAVYDRRLRAVIAQEGARIERHAVERVRPIDPLAAAGAAAEEEAAFAAYVLTTLHPAPAAAGPDVGGEEEVLAPVELYAGFTYAAPLPDGRLFVAVPEECGAYQCVIAPFLVDQAAGSAARLAVEVEAAGGSRPRVDPGARPLGIPSVRGNLVEVFEQARGAGDCGVRWRYRVVGTTLALVQAVEKAACDGAGWDGARTRNWGP